MRLTAYRESSYGIPLGAVLTVLGISYGLYAWMLDQVFSQRGNYNNGAWVCLS
jgi:hypothetical protein